MTENDNQTKPQTLPDAYDPVQFENWTLDLGHPFET